MCTWHAGAAHSHDPSFSVQCGVNGCTRSYSNYSSFRRHLKRRHTTVLDPPLQQPGSDPNDGDDNSLEFPLESSVGEPEDSLDIHQRALFLLKSREIHKMSQLAISDIITDVTLITESVLVETRRKVQAVLAANNTSLSDFNGLDDVFQDPQLTEPFSSLLTDHHQTKFYREHMSLVVSDVAIDYTLYTYGDLLSLHHALGGYYHVSVVVRQLHIVVQKLKRLCIMG